jgi:hypothetical protein
LGYNTGDFFHKLIWSPGSKVLAEPEPEVFRHDPVPTKAVIFSSCVVGSCDLNADRSGQLFGFVDPIITGLEDPPTTLPVDLNGNKSFPANFLFSRQFLIFPPISYFPANFLFSRPFLIFPPFYYFPANFYFPPMAGFV